MFYKPQLCQVLIRTHTYSHIHCTYKVNWATRQTNTHIHMQPVTARLFGSLADSWPLAKRQCATNYAVGLLRSLWPRSLLMQRPPTLQHLVTDKYLCQCLCVRSSIHLQMHACKHAAFYCSQFTECPVKFPLVPMKYTHTHPHSQALCHIHILMNAQSTRTVLAEPLVVSYFWYDIALWVLLLLRLGDGEQFCNLIKFMQRIMRREIFEIALCMAVCVC